MTSAAPAMASVCIKSTQPTLDWRGGTAGAFLNVQRTAPAPVGITVDCENRLTEAYGRRLACSVRFLDEDVKFVICGDKRHKKSWREALPKPIVKRRFPAKTPLLLYRAENLPDSRFQNPLFFGFRPFQNSKLHFDRRRSF